MLSDEQLEHWAKLADCATPAPWEAFEGEGLGEEDNYRWGVDTPEGPFIEADDAEAVTVADAEFIAQSREAVPALIAEVRRQRELLDLFAREPLCCGPLPPDTAALSREAVEAIALEHRAHAVRLRLLSKPGFLEGLKKAKAGRTISLPELIERAACNEMGVKVEEPE